MNPEQGHSTLAGSDVPTLADETGVGDATSGALGPATLNMLGRDILGQYHVLSKLGQGGMGTVYLAEQIGMQRQVAIKVLNVSENADAARRFQVEAQAVARLDSPHIVSVYNYGRLDTGEFYIAMELLEGQTLRADLTAQGRFSLPRVVDLVAQIARGLDEAHRHSVIHRDLKPSNIMLVPRRGGEWVKLLDFGIAKVDAGNSTQTRGWMGTPQYMAPEQFTGDSVDARTDVYALGLIAYEMLCGRTPFLSDNPMSYVHNHVYSAVPALGHFGAADVPASVEAVLFQALAKAPDARPQTASAFAEALARAVHTPPGAPPKRSGAGPIVLASLLGVGVVAGGGGILYTVLRDRPEPVVASDDAPAAEGSPLPVVLGESEKEEFDPAYVAQLPEDFRALVKLDEDELLSRLDHSMDVYPPSMRPQVRGQYTLQLASMLGDEQATARKVVLINGVVAMAASAKYVATDPRTTEALLEDYYSRPGPVPREMRKEIIENMRESVAQPEDRDWTIRQWLIQLELHEKKQEEKKQEEKE